MSVAKQEPIAVGKSAEPTCAWPNLPRMVEIGGVLSPESPLELSDIDVESSVLHDLALKLVSTAPNLNTHAAARELRLPLQVVDEIFWKLQQDQLVEVQGSAGPLGYRYGVTQRGRDVAQRLLDVSGYVGPVPVSLAAYTAAARPAGPAPMIARS